MPMMPALPPPSSSALVRPPLLQAFLQETPDLLERTLSELSEVDLFFSFFRSELSTVNLIFSCPDFNLQTGSLL